MKRVLVTGASGFIGSHVLAPLLERGYEVHAVRLNAEQKGPAVWHQADLLDADPGDRPASNGPPVAFTPLSLVPRARCIPLIT